MYSTERLSLYPLLCMSAVLDVAGHTDIRIESFTALLPHQTHVFTNRVPWQVIQAATNSDCALGLLHEQKRNTLWKHRPGLFITSLSVLFLIDAPFQHTALCSRFLRISTVKTVSFQESLSPFLDVARVPGCCLAADCKSPLRLRFGKPFPLLDRFQDALTPVMEWRLRENTWQSRLYGNHLSARSPGHYTEDAVAVTSFGQQTVSNGAAKEPLV